MRFNTFRYLLGEGVRSLWINRFMAAASVFVLVACMLLTGFAYLLFANIDSAFDWVYGQNVVAAFTVEDFPESRRQLLADRILAMDNIAGVEITTKEEMLEKYGSAMPEGGVRGELEKENPYTDVYIVSFIDVAIQDQSIALLKSLSDIEDISYNGDIAQVLTRAREIILLAGSWIIVLLLAVSLFIISNTIKLTVYSRRLEISIMKSVGATNAFVRFPFIVEGILLGILAAIISFLFTWLAYSRLAGAFESGVGMFTVIVKFTSVWSGVAFGYLIIGIIMGSLGSVVSIGRYLKSQGGISGVL